MKIELVNYNPEWPKLFQAEKEALMNRLSGIESRIEHIGSTSIEGLCAKPIIDIMIGLNDFGLADQIIDRIVALEYLYVDKYNDIMPERRFFQKHKGNRKTHHIHMVGLDTEFWNRHLAFRDQLRNSKTDREDYANLKKQLAKQEWSDGNEYANAKTDFIRGIERKALDHRG